MRRDLNFGCLPRRCGGSYGELRPYGLPAVTLFPGCWHRPCFMLLDGSPKPACCADRRGSWCHREDRARRPRGFAMPVDPRGAPNRHRAHAAQLPQPLSTPRAPTCDGDGFGSRYSVPIGEASRIRSTRGMPVEGGKGGAKGIERCVMRSAQRGRRSRPLSEGIWGMAR